MADARDTGAAGDGRVTRYVWYVATVHNEETEETQTIGVNVGDRFSAAEMAVRSAFHCSGWHHTRCDPVADVEERCYPAIGPGEMAV